MASNAILVPDDGMGIEVIEAAGMAFGATGLAFRQEFEGSVTTPIDSVSRSVDVAQYGMPNLRACHRPCDTRRSASFLSEDVADVDTIMTSKSGKRRERSPGGLRNAK